MTIRFPFPAIHAAAAAAVLALASCATDSTPTVDADGKPVNPYPPGTYDHFKAEPSYPKTHTVWKNSELLKQTNASNSHIVINLATQRGMLMNGGEVVIDYPITSGKSSHPTPKGEFEITEMLRNKSSNKYGTIYNADGKSVIYPADITRHEVPEGGEFVGSPMNYWMRLTNDGVGLHVGPMRRYPASHGCIRGPSATHPIVYSKVKVGTRVVIE